MQRRSALFLSIGFIAAVLSFSGCQQNPANPPSPSENLESKILSMSAYKPDLPVENKIKLAQELTLKGIDQSMSAVTAMFPDLEKSFVLENDDPKNLLHKGQEVWYYSKEIDKTFVVNAPNYSLILIFNGKEMTDQDLEVAKSMVAEMNGGKAPETKTISNVEKYTIEDKASQEVSK